MLEFQESFADLMSRGGMRSVCSNGSHFTSKQNNPFGEYSSHTGSKRMNTIVELYPLLLCRNWGLMLTDLCPRYQKPGFFCGIF